MAEPSVTVTAGRKRASLLAHALGLAETQTRMRGAEFRAAVGRDRPDAQAPDLRPSAIGIEQARAADAGALRASPARVRHWRARRSWRPAGSTASPRDGVRRRAALARCGPAATAAARGVPAGAAAGRCAGARGPASPRLAGGHAHPARLHPGSNSSAVMVRAVLAHVEAPAGRRGRCAVRGVGVRAACVRRHSALAIGNAATMRSIALAAAMPVAMRASAATSARGCDAHVGRRDRSPGQARALRRARCRRDATPSFTAAA